MFLAGVSVQSRDLSSGGLRGSECSVLLHILTTLIHNMFCENGIVLLMNVCPHVNRDDLTCYCFCMEIESE